MNPRRRTERPTARKFRVTDRDSDVLHAVGRMGQATTDQLRRLFFGERSTATKRLAKLVSLRLLDVHVREVSSPNVYTLGLRGVELLVGAGTDRSVLHRSRVGRHLDEHLRALNDVRVAFVLAARDRADIQLDAFHGDLDLRRAAGASVPAYLPDFLGALSLPTGNLVLVGEIDLGSEGIASVFARKVDATVAIWRDRRKCWGAAPGTWRPVAFVPSDGRARSLARMIVERGGGDLWLVSDIERVRRVGVLEGAFSTATEVAATPRRSPIAYTLALASAPTEVSA